MTRTALLLLLAAPAPIADAPAPGHYRATGQPAVAAGLAGPSAELPLATDGYERLTVPVRLGAAGPYRFLVDTGSDRTAVSRELAGKLGLAGRDQLVMHSATGASQVRIAFLPEIFTGKRSVRDIRAPMLDAANIGADGILGIDSLHSQRVVFDFLAQRLSIHSGRAAQGQDDNVIVVRARRLQGRLVITDAEVNGERVAVVLDTGSSLTVGNAALRRKLERRGGINPVGPIDLVSVTGASLRGELGRVDRLDIAGARLEGLSIAFAEAHTFRQLGLGRKPALLLGMNALRGFDRVTIDFAGRSVSLMLPPDGKRRLPAG